MTDTAVANGFDHINLNEVDPIGMRVPLGTPINFVVSEAAKKDYSTEKGSGSYVSFKFTIVDSPEFSGRSFYKSLFADKPDGKQSTARQLRILMDSTGIQQTGEFAEWLADLVAQRATFSAPLEERTQKDGKVRTEPNMWKVSVALN